MRGQAEDIAQDTVEAFLAAGPATVQQPAAWAQTTAARKIAADLAKTPVTADDFTAGNGTVASVSGMMSAVPGTGGGGNLSRSAASAQTFPVGALPSMPQTRPAAPRRRAASARSLGARTGPGGVIPIRPIFLLHKV